MPLNGQMVMIDLESLANISYSVEQASAPGILKNFALKLSGLKKEGDPNDANSYFGGHVSIADGAANFTSDGYWNNLAVNYPGAMIKFHFNPQRSLRGRKCRFNQTDRLQCGRSSAGKISCEFPLRLVPTNGSINNSPRRSKTTTPDLHPWSDRPHYDYLDLTFPPDPSDRDGHPYNPYVAVWAD